MPTDTAQNTTSKGCRSARAAASSSSTHSPPTARYSFRSRASPATSPRARPDPGRAARRVTVDGERVSFRLGQGDQEHDRQRPRRRGAIKAGCTPSASPPGDQRVPGTELNKPFQRTMNKPGEIPGFLFYPHFGHVTIEGPFNGTTPATREPAQGFSSPPDQRAH